MKKGVVIAGILTVAVAGAGSTAALYVTKMKESKPAAPVMAVATPAAVPVEFATWTDPTGFSFQYPKDLILTNHEEDQDNYAHVEFTKKDQAGNIIIWAKDISVSTPSDWVKNEKSFFGATVVDTTLGGLPAKKILITQPTKKIIVGTVSDGILFTVEGTIDDADYWMKIHDGVVNSFAFAPDTSAKSSPSGSDKGTSDDRSIDEEEVVQ